MTPTGPQSNLHNHNEGDTVQPTEHNANTASTSKTGLFALLSAFLPFKGSGAPSTRLTKRVSLGRRAAVKTFTRNNNQKVLSHISRQATTKRISTKRGCAAHLRNALFSPPARVKHALFSLPALVLASLAFTAAPALAAAPEAPVAGPVSAITATKATFEGVVNPGTLAQPPQSGTYEFLYKASTKQECEGESKGSQGMVFGVGPEPVPAEPVSGLKPGTEYAVCLRVENAAKEVTVSPPVTFTTVPMPVNEAPNPIGSTTATFHGTLTPSGSGLEYVFFYNVGETPECTNEFQTAGSTLEPVEIVSPALEPKQKYTVCLYVYNTVGVFSAEEASPPEHFETLAAPPAVEGESASPVKATEATLSAVVNPNNEKTSAHLQYSTSSSVNGSGGLITPTVLASSELGEGYGGQTVGNGALTGLPAGTTFYYQAVATNTTGTTYGAVKSFRTITPSKEQATAITGTTATLNGVLNPARAGEADAYEFLYKASPTQCEGESATSYTSVSGGLAEPVKTELTSLLPHTTYTFCVQEYNEVSEATIGSAVTFTTAAAGVTAGSSAEVGATSAKLNAQIDPGGAETSYYVEYGTSVAYGSSTTPEASAGAGSGYVGVQTTLAGLQSDTLYHFRFVAKNSFGTAPGPDATFTTFPPSASALPDNRAYELVSDFPAGTGEEAYVPSVGFGYIEQNEHGIHTDHPFRVSPDGEAVLYLGDPPPAGGTGSRGVTNGNEYLARRTSGGWEATDIEPPREGTYQAFSSDLSVGILSSNTLGGGTGEYGDFYTHATASGAGGEYDPFYTGTPSYRTRQGPEGFVSFYAGGNAGTSAVPAFSYLLLEANDALQTSNVNVTAVGGSGEDPVSHRPFATEHNLYDSAGGGLYLVNVLPEGRTEVNASFGQSVSGGTHLISADGSRIFWTDLNTGALYVRENATAPDASTVLVAEGGEFWAANSEGSLVFYTKAGSLYSFDLYSGLTTDLSVAINPSEKAEVQGVVGSSEDGSYVYFAAQGKLASNVNANREEAKTGGDNLYLSHEGSTTFIGTLSPEDGSEAPPFTVGGNAGGDWQAAGGRRTAEVTPDGQSLVFMSNESLTGYDNGTQRNEEGIPVEEVFLFQAQSGKLTCVSCNPSGEPPVPTEFNVQFPFEPIGGFIPTSRSVAGEQPRVISEDGNRIFFDSGEPLLPTATNGWLNVYEWERAGTPGGSCPQGAPGGGCVYLLSSGTDPEDSYLLGADASGANAFFISRAQLVPQDRGNEGDVVYDARVDGVQPPAAPACEGTGCQGVPPTPPIFATPASVTFNGTGNFSSPTPAKKVTKKTAKCKRGLVKNKKDKCIKPKKKSKKAKRASRNRKGNS
jgi:hypothetical protein